MKTTTLSELTYAERIFQISSNETKTLGVPFNKLSKKLINSNEKKHFKLCGLNI